MKRCIISYEIDSKFQNKFIDLIDIPRIGDIVEFFYNKETKIEKTVSLVKFQEDSKFVTIYLK